MKSLKVLLAAGLACAFPTQIPLMERIPTPYESAVLARRIYHLASFATVSSTFPSQASAEWIQPPENLSGAPISLPEYYSPNCSSLFEDEDHGNPLLLALNVATYVRHAKAGSNITLSLSWKPSKEIYSPASLPRMALIGRLEAVDGDEKALGTCFTQAHPDARWWLPGNAIHSSYFARLVVEGIYWVGGFGDRAYIGWLDMSDWRSIPKKEWSSVRLPGEV